MVRSPSNELRPLPFYHTPPKLLEIRIAVLKPVRVAERRKRNAME